MLKLRYIIVFILLLVSVEFSLRFILGLGNPPLSIEHKNIEYLFKSNQDLYRFRNHFYTNDYGMRSEFFDREKKYELRIMLFGDSVLNGGVLTDQNNLASYILQNKVSNFLNKKVIVGNISAGSWGPGNCLAYAKEYGFFDADIIGLVISSHDYADSPSFQPLDPNTHPTHRPISAIVECLTRYVVRYIPSFFEKSRIKEHGSLDNMVEINAKKSLGDLKEFLLLAKSNARYVYVFQHFEQKEIYQGHADVGYRLIRDVCKDVGVPSISLENCFQQSMTAGHNPYRDNIHPNDLGQELIAQSIFMNLPIGDMK